MNSEIRFSAEQKKEERSTHINPVVQPIFPAKKAAEENRSLSECIISSAPAPFSHTAHGTITRVNFFCFFFSISKKAVAYRLSTPSQKTDLAHDQLSTGLYGGSARLQITRQPICCSTAACTSRGLMEPCASFSIPLAKKKNKLH